MTDDAPRSPVSSPTIRQHASPLTPNAQNLSNIRMSGEFSTLDNSPTSTLSESPSFHLDTSRSTFSTVLASSSIPPTLTRRRIVRSDPALLTCFDPADKELYDLWAHKN